ncbi:TPA_asm: L [Bouteloa betacytorhabdovirus 1]|nr:TPA_asm: L [Bouteloa betacytorhabdovirus 1]
MLGMDLDEIFKVRHKRGLGDYHLRSALLLVDLTSLEQGKGRVREQKSYNKINRIFDKKKLQPGYPVTLLTILSQCVPNLPRKQIGWVAEANLLIAEEVKALNKIFPATDLLTLLLAKSTRTDWSSPLVYVRDILLLSLLYLMAITSEREPPDIEFILKDAKFGIPLIQFDTVKIYLTGELIVWTSQHSTNYELISLDSFRMVCDKFTERCNVWIASIVGNEISPEIYPQWEIIENLFWYLDRYLQIRGNQGYKLLKTYEALITGIILSREQCRYWPSDKFLSNTLDGLDKYDRKVANKLCNFLKENTSTIHHLTQLAGLFRLWGHPVVDARKGVEKVRLIGTADKKISKFTSEIAGNQLKEILFMNYFAKNHIYPNHTITPGKDISYLEECLIEGLPINLKSPNYCLFDWENINLLRTFDIPSSFNLSMIVSDTAISPTREEMHQCYVEGRPGLDPTIRRGVLKWMKDGVLDCPKLLKHVDENPKGLPKTYRIIGLYQKERELNPIARMFALMSLIMRSVMVVTESILADHVLPLIPGITMTYSMLDLTKEMIKATWRQRDIDKYSVTFCINMDFEKWNLNMRKDATFHVFQVLGELFGLPNIFNRTYDIFENSIIYRADGSFVLPISSELDLIETDLNDAYIGHKGGFEGLRQKGWTIYTVVLIHYCCKKLNIDWKLMGQGDNQVLLATIYSKNARSNGLSSAISQAEIQAKLKELLDELINLFNSVGLPLKPLETWVSDSFFSYGKFPIYKGMPCSMSLKKLSRVFFFSNEDIMTLDNALGSVTANAQSAVMADIHPAVSYFVAKLQHLQCINLFYHYHPLLGESPCPEKEVDFTMTTRDRKKRYLTVERSLMKRQEIVALSCFPKTLGGLNIVTYFNMIMRGFSDPVTQDYQWLTAMSHTTIPWLNWVFNNLKNLILNPEINYSYLLQDPVGLNLFVPTNSTQAIKQMIHRVIHNLPFQSEFAEWFKEVMEISDPEEITSLANQLTDTDELNVRFLHDILGSTIFGYCDSITSKIDKTVTLSRIALSNEDVVGKIMKNEKRYLRYLLWRLHTKGTYVNDTECPSKYIRDIRDEGWKKKIKGVSVPFPFHFLSRVSGKRPESYLIATADDEALVASSYVTTSIGKSLPYLGSVTKEKVPLSASRLAYGIEPLITRPVRMLRTIGWFVDETSNFAELLRNLLRAVSDINVEDLINIPDDVKGSMVHRYSDFATKHGSLWMTLYGPATFLNLSTNYLTEYSKGGKNVTLHFQAVLCYLQMIAVNDLLAGVGKKTVILEKCCSNCITEIDDEFEDLSSSIEKSVIPSRPQNPYLYLSKERISFMTRHIEDKLKSVRKGRLSDLRTDDAYTYLVDWVACKIASQIFYQGESSSDYLLDVQSISRVIFLKVNPLHVLEGICKFLYLLVSQREEKNQTFPSFETIKATLMKSLNRFPSSRYGIFSGFFLWKDNMPKLRVLNASFPMSYPITPQSAADASKKTIIQFVKSYKGELKWSQRAMVINQHENQFPLMLKQVALKGKSESESKCLYCCYGLTHLKFKSYHSVSDLMFEKCQKGHFLFHVRDLAHIIYLPTADIESLSDLLPHWQIPPKSIESSLKTEVTKDEIKCTQKSLFGSKHVVRYDINVINPKRKNYQRVQESDILLELSFSIPTRGIYRGLELMAASTTKKTSKQNILMMGDGYGSTSLSISSMPRSPQKIVSWTYIRPSEAISHCLQESRPPMLYYFDNEIILSPSFEEVSKVGCPLFATSFRQVVEQYSITILVSDIEWWYLGDDYTETLVQLAYTHNISEIILRVFTDNFQQLLDILETTNHYFESWEIIQSLNIKPMLGDVILRASKRRETLSPSIYHFDQETISKIDLQISCDLTEYQSITSIKNSYIPKLEKNLLEQSSWMSVMTGICDEWFSKAEIVGWLDKDFTRLYYSIKTGRRPQDLEDVSGSEIFYFRESWYNQLVVRLFALAMALCNDPSEVSYALGFTWEPEWVFGKSMYRGKKKSRLCFVRKSWKTKWSNQDLHDIKGYSSLIRTLRRYHLKEDSITFKRIGDVIEFKHNLKNREMVHLQISKLASYSLL